MIRMVAVRADYYGRRQPRRPRRLDARDARRDAPLTMIPPLLPPLLPFPLVHAHLLAPMHARIRATASLAVARRVDTSRKGAMGKGERGREGEKNDQDFRTSMRIVASWWLSLLPGIINVAPSRFA